ncbi:hypothetical protein MTO96_000282 [Rhipicephalus appendiculatus]
MDNFKERFCESYFGRLRDSGRELPRAHALRASVACIDVRSIHVLLHRHDVCRLCSHASGYWQTSNKLPGPPAREMRGSTKAERALLRSAKRAQQAAAAAEKGDEDNDERPSRNGN